MVAEEVAAGLHQSLDGVLDEWRDSVFGADRIFSGPAALSV